MLNNYLIALFRCGVKQLMALTILVMSSGVLGPTPCPACKAGVEIDDRGESVFLNLASPRMPMYGAGVNAVWPGAAGQTGHLWLLWDDFELDATLTI